MNRVASNKVRNNGPTSLLGRARLTIFSSSSRRCNLQPTTTAWNCLDVIPFQMEQNPIAGAVISSDIQLGHAMVVRFSNGSMITINLTGRRHLCEMVSFTEPCYWRRLGCWFNLCKRYNWGLTGRVYLGKVIGERGCWFLYASILKYDGEYQVQKSCRHY